ncbi:thiol reductant ABC exporter subunit CydD [Salinicola sp. MIT1003]|uniref:thiol reductant ABC exporter subunit CydD n=1 Tax=Salinicola sp. MIT1003 TaxID=1882734 RepID=UPI0008DE3BBF|nr:thiol reductant ABC exporter subunit CydD [Salinicola sp. MIT1003]OHZ04327.1 thiol reductant ABC exporter subunit CydD [Salinicola sp. MIT1003]
MKQQAAGVRPWYRGAVGCGLLAGLATLVQMGALAWVVDDVVSNQATLGDVAFGVALIAIAIGVRAVAQWGQEVCGQACGLRVKQQVRARLLVRLQQLGPVRLAARHSAGLASQLVDQVESLEGYYSRFLPQMVLAALIPLVYLVVVFWLNWLAAIWLLIAAPLIPLFMALIGMGAQRLNEAQFQAVTRLSGHFLDRVRGIATLQLFGLAERSVEEVSEVAHDYRRRSLKTLRVAFLSSAVLEFFAAVSVAVVAIYIGLGLLGYIQYGPAEQLDLFSGLFILLLAPEFFQPLRTLSQHYHDRASALGAAEGLVSLLEPDADEAAPAESDRSDETASRELVPGAVELVNVELRHAGRERILGPLSLRVDAGEVVALIGPSGSGKSSLLQLIAGFIAPNEGTVGVQREPAIAWLDQRPLIIQGTLADNLRLVAPDASDESLRNALTQAGLGQWLASAPGGLETPLGERGVGLSGGEGQRLALARVFLSPARLVLLDEPTAALDPETEQHVIAGLTQLAASGRTLIVATHHPAIMAMAGRVFAIEQGRLSRIERSADARETNS